MRKLVSTGVYMFHANMYHTHTHDRYEIYDIDRTDDYLYLPPCQTQTPTKNRQPSNTTYIQVKRTRKRDRVPGCGAPSTARGALIIIIIMAFILSSRVHSTIHKMQLLHTHTKY